MSAVGDLSGSYVATCIENDDHPGIKEDHYLKVSSMAKTQWTANTCSLCNNKAEYRVMHTSPGIPFTEYLCQRCTSQKTAFYEKKK